MNEEGLHGVADAGTLHFGVEDNLLRHGKVGAGIDKDVADPFVVLDDGNAGMLGDEADQALAAARDDQVDLFIELEEFEDRFPVSGCHHLQCRRRQMQIGQHLLQEGADGAVGMDRFRAAAQDDGIAALQAEGGGIGGDIGPRLVDDADDTEGDAHAPDLQTVGAPPHAGDFTDRVGEGGDFTQAGGHGAHPFFIEGEAIEHRRREALGATGAQILFVGGEQGGDILLQCHGHAAEHFILDGA